MKIVVLGDAHVRNRTWPRLDLYGDAFAALQEVTDAARSERAVLCATGDLLDNGRGADAPRCIQEVLRQTDGLGHIVYAVGNHDRTGAAGGARNPEWVEAALDRRYAHQDEAGRFMVGDCWHYLEGLAHEIDGVRFAVVHHCLSADDFDDRLRALETGKVAFDVLVCHQGTDRTLGHAGAFEITVKDAAPRLAQLGCRLCLVGHVHTSMDWVTDEVRFVSPGNLVRDSLNAASAARYPVIDFSPGRTPAVEWRDLQAVRPIRQAVASEPDDYPAALDDLRRLIRETAGLGLPPAVAKPIFSVRYVNRPGFLRELEELAGPDVCLDLLPYPSAELLTNEPAVETAEPRPDDLAADIARVTERHAPEGPVREALLSIQRGDDVTTVLEAHLTRLTA